MPDPLIAAERQVSLTGNGMLTNYKEYPANPLGKSRQLGWTPGLHLRVSDLFSAGRIDGLYAAVEMDGNIGNVGLDGSYYNTRSGRTEGSFSSTSNNTKAYGRVELGKAWRITRRLMVIPTVQGGYGYWERSSDSGYGTPFGSDYAYQRVSGSQERYRYAWAGGALHVDYAITPRLVAKLTGEFGETFQGRMQNEHAPATFYLGDRLRLEAGAVVDYRLTARLHLLADVDYQQFGFGRSHDARAPGYRTFYEPTSQTQQLRLGAGVAFGF